MVVSKVPRRSGMRPPGAARAGRSFPASLAMPFTRTRYEAGRQCHLRLWHDLHAPHLATGEDRARPSAVTAAEVRRRARDRFPGGKWAGGETGEAVAKTGSLAAAGVPAIFGAAFECDGVVARADVLERRREGGWRLVRVKAAKKIKDRDVSALAFDLWAARQAGFEVRDAGLLVLNGRYRYDGVRLDLGELFRYHSRVEEAEELLPGIAGAVRAMRAAMSAEEAPVIAPGDHCRVPFPCPYLAHCARDLPSPVHGIGELPKPNAKQRAALEALGIEEIADIPPDFDLTDRQRTARQSVVEGRAVVHGDLGRRLDELETPVRHLDFERYMPPIPRFAGTAPFEELPYLFSVHTEEPGTAPRHEDYLHEGIDDPRPELTRRLLAALGDSGSICVYSSAEQRILESLERSQPQHATALGAVLNRLYDLLPVVKNTVYDPGFRGSFSLKRTLPALVPGLGYDDLEVSDGLTAAATYGEVIQHGDENDRRRVFADLRKYCERDTLAMVELHRALRELARGRRRP